MKALVLALLLFIASPLHAQDWASAQIQQSFTRIEQIDSKPRTITPVVLDSAVYASLRWWVTDCTGLTWTTDPHIFYRTPFVQSDSSGRYIFHGEYITPDTIFIDPIEVQNASNRFVRWVYAHEMLHFLIGPQPPNTNLHPPGKFIPCGLYETQKPKKDAT